MRFQEKNLHFLLKNIDFPIKNLHCLIKNLHFYIKPDHDANPFRLKSEKYSSMFTPFCSIMLAQFPLPWSGNTPGDGADYGWFTEQDLELIEQVSFQWKNPDFLLTNPDFLIRNSDFPIEKCWLHNETGGGAAATAPLGTRAPDGG